MTLLQRLKIQVTMIFLFILILSGCATQRLEFGPDVMTKYKLSGEDIMQLQFFLTEPIYLRRMNVQEYVNQIEFHVLRQKKTDEHIGILIKEGTPGVPIGMGDNWIDVDFGHDIVIRFMHFMGGNKIRLFNGQDIFRKPVVVYREEEYILQFEEYNIKLDESEFRKVPEIAIDVATQQSIFNRDHVQVVPGKKMAD